MTTQTAHFSKYTSRMDDFIVAQDLQAMEHLNFQTLLTAEVVQKLMVKRNGRNGTQYRIIDLFNHNVAFYALIFNGLISINDNNEMSVNFGKPRKYNVKMWSWLFPKGFPQTEKQLASWLSYVGWVAHNRFA